MMTRFSLQTTPKAAEELDRDGVFQSAEASPGRTLI
jgi:hypothetical protein